MAEMKTLNGYEVVDAKAREQLNDVRNTIPTAEKQAEWNAGMVEVVDGTITLHIAASDIYKQNWVRKYTVNGKSMVFGQVHINYSGQKILANSSCNIFTIPEGFRNNGRAYVNGFIQFDGGELISKHLYINGESLWIDSAASERTIYDVYIDFFYLI